MLENSTLAIIFKDEFVRLPGVLHNLELGISSVAEYVIGDG